MVRGIDKLQHHNLFFDEERYDLSAVGRVKMSARLNLDVDDSVRTLRKIDILSILKVLVNLKDGHGEIDDIDHLGNRRVRSVGELLENQYRVGLLRMERAIRERMSSANEIENLIESWIEQNPDKIRFSLEKLAAKEEKEKIENNFSNLYPDKWMPLYSQVTFSQIRYSKALAEGKKQDAIMQKVMKIQNIEKLWNSEEVNNFILNSLK